MMGILSAPTARLALGCFVLMLGASQTLAQDDDDDLYAELDAFAAAHLDGIQPRSFAENVEFCGYYGLDRDQQIASTPPTRGDADGCLPEEAPYDWEVLASWHTHGAYTQDADIEVPSLDDLLGDIAEGIDGYIATPGGRIWLNLYEERTAVLMCGPGCIAADPRYRDCAAFMPGEEYTVQTLQDRFDNDPGYC